MNDINHLVTQIKQSTDYQQNKRILREKIYTDLLFTHNGGLFVATPALYSFVKSWRWPHHEMILEDNYLNPIKINKQEFLQTFEDHYQMAMNAWHIEHENLKQIRKI